MGQFLGRFDLALAGYDHPAAHRSFIWNVQSVNQLRILINKNNTDKKIINYYLDFFKNEVLAVELVNEDKTGEFTDQFQIGDQQVQFGLERVNI